MHGAEIHKGHRGRICKRSQLVGFEFLEEHEQLEKLLFAVIPRGNTNEVAHRLLKRFGSLYDVLCADVDDLKEIEGVGSRVAEFLTDLPELLGVVERCVLNGKEGAVLDTTEKAGEYLQSLFYNKPTENLYMVCLNSAYRVIRFDKVSVGTATSASVSVHNICKTALMNEATYVMLAHNHPGGRCEPSNADITMTRMVGQALESLGIALKYHFVVTQSQWRCIYER